MNIADHPIVIAFQRFVYVRKVYPFDIKTPIGFTIAIAIQFKLLSHATMIAACDIAMAIAAFLYGISMSECMKINLSSIIRHAHHKEKRVHILREIIDFVKFHAHAKQLSKTLTSNTTKTNLDSIFMATFHLHTIL